MDINRGLDKGECRKLSDPEICRTRVNGRYPAAVISPIDLRRFDIMNRKKKTSAFRAVTACALSATLLLSSGCGRPKDAGKQGGTVYVITKQQQYFWDEVKSGAEDACSEHGFDIVYSTALGDNDYSSQRLEIQKAIRNNADAIVIAPNSPTDLNEEIQKALDRGIKVVTIDSTFAGPNPMEPLALSFVNASESEGGVSAARNALDKWKNVRNKDIDDIGKVGVVLSTASTSESCMESFIDTMKRAIGATMGVEFPVINPMAAMAGGDPAAMAGGAGSGEYISSLDSNPADLAAANAEPEAELSDAEIAAMEMQKAQDAADERIRENIMKNFYQTEKCGTREMAKEEALKLLGSDGNGFSIMFATNTNTTLGLCDAIAERGLTGKILVIGYNADPDEINLLRTGVVDGLIVQNPYVMGYVGVKNAIKMCNGDEVTHHLNIGVNFVDANALDTDEFIKLILNPNGAEE